MKDTMVIYTSYLQKFDKLTDEQFGQLMRAGLTYIQTNEVPEIEDMVVAVCFDVLKVEVDINNQKYEETCAKRREAGKKGGLAKASNAKQNLANASTAKQELAKASKSSLNDNENDNDNKKNNLSNERLKEKASTASEASVAIFVPPTLEETKKYFKDNHFKKKAERFFNYYQARGWESITDWKACANAWEQNHIADSVVKPNFNNFDQREYDYEQLEKMMINSG